ncbi:MAG: trypsin-like peptidase domain-containing protein [Bacteroidota bacterium]
MFTLAIEKALQYTRPLHNIHRTYGGILMPGSSTFFFVNNEGVAVTCKHVLNSIIAADEINNNYQKFRAEKNRIPNDGKYKIRLQALETKYKYAKETVVQFKNNFLNCFDQINSITTHAHPTLDLAILEFKGFNKLHYQGHASFMKDTSRIKQGKSLCRLGFPFPEFNNFQYNEISDDIEWTNTGNPNSPSFPIDGIVTRFLGDPKNREITGIELSTPGLRGQSGGPLFDVHGVVAGMQFATNHLHLGFDMKDHEINADGRKAKVSNYPFLHTGLCVHATAIKQFLSDHNIRFTEVD